jgi:hypothetical protein
VDPDGRTLVGQHGNGVLQGCERDESGQTMRVRVADTGETTPVAEEE